MKFIKNRNNKMICIETNRLIIRDAEASDFDRLLPAYNKKENMQFIKKEK